MNIEIQKRPFVRPLLFWILGIVFSLYIGWPVWMGILLSVVFILLFFSAVSSSILQLSLSYHARWVKGGILLMLIFALSSTVSHLSKTYPLPSIAITSQAADLQFALVEKIDRLALEDREKSVLATLILGYKKVLPRDVREIFSLTGVSHILAVSGFHVAVVAGFLSLLFSWLPRNSLFIWLRYLVLMVSVWGFVFLTGMAVSSIRAGIMFSFYQTGKILKRPSDNYNTLAASAFCMLAYKPAFLFDIGFQLSYLAVFSILYLQPRLVALIQARNPIFKLPWRWITVTLAAQAGTTFLCLYYFGHFSPLFLYANLPVIFFANILIPAGLVWLLLPSGIPGYTFLQGAVESLTEWMLSVVEFIASLPGVSLNCSFGFISMLLGYALLVFTGLYFKVKRPRILLIALSSLFILILILLIERIVRE